MTPFTLLDTLRSADYTFYRRTELERPYMMRKSFLLKISLIVISFAWVLLSRIPPGTQNVSAFQAPRSGFTAPDFILDTHAGGHVSLSDLRGKPVIINFWASWCPPCRAEMPAFQEAADEFSDTDLVILGVNSTSQDSLSDVNLFIDDYQLEFTIPLDLSGEVSRDYQIHSLPTTYFINEDGTIVKVIVGGPIPLSLLRIEARQLIEGVVNVPDN